ncbi:MAG: hypothetical protein JRF63_06810, partial [Deltaproteobacteria bacterium]|nr:hypothetical protein [Deltaproteobacteria bacterium]
MEKRAFFILFVGGLMLAAGAVMAQDDAPELDDPFAEEDVAAESGDEAKKAEDAPAEGEEKPAEGEEKPAEGEEKPAEGEEEAPAEETPPAEPATDEAAGEEAAAAAEEAPVDAAAAGAEKEAAEEGEGEESEEGDGEEGEAPERPFRRTFAGTAFYWDNSFTAVSLDKSHDYAWNPNYVMGFGFVPVWNVTDSVSLSTALGFSVELTNSDFSNERNEVFFNDIPVNASYRYRADINDDVMFSTGLNGGFTLPTSRMSRYVTLYTALKIGTGATFIFPKVMQGLSLGWKPSFTKYFHASENPTKAGNPLDESPIPDTEKATSEHYQALAYSPGKNPSWRLN